MNKIDKYIHKYNKSNKNLNDKSYYLIKLSEHIYKINSKNMYGGTPNDDIGDTSTVESSESSDVNTQEDSYENKLNELFNYVKTKIKSEKITKKNYLVFLYGPPASGKSIARTIACNEIKKTEGLNSDLDNIHNSFVDTGVDEIVYHYAGNKLENAFKKKFSVLKDSTRSQASEYTKENFKTLIEPTKLSDADDSIIKQQADSTFGIYSQIKKEFGDSVSDIFRSLAIYLKLNIYMESASYNSSWFRAIFQMCKFYDYIPIVMYPLTDQLGKLCDRNIARSFQEYRLLTCKGKFSIEKKMIDCAKNFDTLIRDINEFFPHDNIIYVYDTDKVTLDGNNKVNFNSVMPLYYSSKLITSDYEVIIDKIKNGNLITVSQP